MGREESANASQMIVYMNSKLTFDENTLARYGYSVMD